MGNLYDVMFCSQRAADDRLGDGYLDADEETERPGVAARRKDVVECLETSIGPAGFMCACEGGPFNRHDTTWAGKFILILVYGQLL